MSNLTALDLSILTFLVEHRLPWFTDFALTLGRAGTTRWLLLVVGLAGAAIVVARNAYRRAALAAIAAVVGLLVARMLKGLLDVPRPPDELSLLPGDGYAFPSTHATWLAASAVAFVGSRAWRSRRDRRVSISALVAAVALVDFCMIYLGSHWFSDVVVGTALGLVVGGVVAMAGRDRRVRATTATERHPSPV